MLARQFQKFICSLRQVIQSGYKLYNAVPLYHSGCCSSRWSICKALIGHAGDEIRIG